MSLQLDLFGPVRARWDGEEVELGPAQRRTLLAVLAFRANQVVTRSELIDAIWGDEAPVSAHGIIYTYVSSLRSTLGPGRTDRGATAVLASSGPGYCLRVEAESIDVVRFENLRDQARSRLLRRDVAGALSALEEALELSHDEPMAGLGGPYLETQRERLKELRLEVVERRAGILLDRGEHQRVLAELTPLAAAHPAREDLLRLQLLALYRCGRRSEAMSLFERLRSATVDEFGIEPGAELTARYEQIRTDDPALWHRQVMTPRTQATARIARTARQAPFVGRSRELSTIGTAIRRLADGRGSSVWIEGEPGIGKSALVNAALANAGACVVVHAEADQLAQHSVLQAVLDCLRVATHPADVRRREVVRTARNLAGADESALALASSLVVQLVRDLCRERPLILVMDDLQWSDPADLEVWLHLAHAADRLPLLLIGVSRRLPPCHRLGHLRARIDRTRTQVHHLAPLDCQEVHGLLTGLTGAVPGPALLALSRAAAGNPLFLRDLVDAVDDDEPPGVVAAEGPPRIPRLTLQTVCRRLGYLTTDAFELLRWAALLARSFTKDDLATALGTSTAELAPVLAEVVAAGLVESEQGRLTFRHPVVREALYARTSPAIRLALHRQLAEAFADAGAPVEHVTFQLLAAPIPADNWFCAWLARHVHQLASRSPLVALRLLRRATSSGVIPAESRERLRTSAARVTRYLSAVTSLITGARGSQDRPARDHFTGEPHPLGIRSRRMGSACGPAASSRLCRKVPRAGLPHRLRREPALARDEFDRSSELHRLSRSAVTSPSTETIRTTRALPRCRSRPRPPPTRPVPARRK
ncbi:BTAD domain-containing putative transcriptional regulator [Amycolatopsis sp. lyj-23]|uniref:BTAD domain-containing putative transcriptional regulator n=1 Tax=Amycolatopsis sp. lyj-23 TaxID=2789283 RepID=UPI0039795441